MKPDLSDLKDKNYEDVRRTLLDKGFEHLGCRDSVCTFYKSGKDCIVKISRRPETAQDFVALCQENEDNPYFPRIYDHFMADNDTHVTVMERLTVLSELPKSDTRRPEEGWADAFASFISKSRTHSLHELFRSSAEFSSLRAAASAIVAHVAKDLKKGGATCLYYKPSPDSIMFRSHNGEFHPVFGNPLQQVPRTAQVEENIRALCKRFDVPCPANSGQKPEKKPSP